MDLLGVWGLCAGSISPVTIGDGRFELTFSRDGREIIVSRQTHTLDGSLEALALSGLAR